MALQPEHSSDLCPAPTTSPDRFPLQSFFPCINGPALTSDQRTPVTDHTLCPHPTPLRAPGCSCGQSTGPTLSSLSSCCRTNRWISVGILGRSVHGRSMGDMVPQYSPVQPTPAEPLSWCNKTCSCLSWEKGGGSPMAVGRVPLACPLVRGWGGWGMGWQLSHNSLHPISLLS